MLRLFPLLVLLAVVSCASRPLHAQMPFYTDDTGVTETGKFHIEAFDELDGLQSSQFPDLTQNTANVKLNFSPIHGLELDIDVPYLDIHRAPAAGSSTGVGDTNLGAKWVFRETPPGTTRTSFAASFYVEFPTGNAQQELGSGLTDYWLNFIVQKPLSDATRINANLGLLFAGNTSTGVVGIQTRRGQVYTGGLSLLHDVSSKLTVGGEGVRRGVRQRWIGQDPAASHARCAIRDTQRPDPVRGPPGRKVRGDSAAGRTGRILDGLPRCHQFVKLKQNHRNVRV